ncbi:MAG: zinc-ribbon domain-containing protein [Clostridia bacterium]|nr:zinc-ribbon domain-containing protein [Clostridia bacterium]
MKYCRKCGNKLDDFDSYCGNCGAKVEERNEYENPQVKHKSVEDSINDITNTASENTESFLCFLLGILSVTCGTFICAILSLVFGKKAIEKGQDQDGKCATFCKVGRICSIVSIVLTAVAVASSLIIGLALPLLLGASIIA